MSIHDQQVSPGTLPSHLLPQPRELMWHRGACIVSAASPIAVQPSDRRLEQALRRWLSSFVARQFSDSAAIHVAVDPVATGQPHGYRLNIQPDRICIAGASAAACFHGIQTLTQLAQPDGQVRCCTVTDWPDFAVRGLLHDITRGKVPRLDTLKLLADRLASLKVNQLQLYIEHAFMFSFDPEICPPGEGLTPNEVRELDSYCKDRFIDLVPAVANLGHMGRILSMPKYRHLAEVEATRSWAEMAWPERMRGFTLDCMNPEAQQLVGRMWSDVLSTFSSPVVNICGDEPWDLGAGKNRQKLAGAAKAEAYVSHLLRVHELCAAQGRRTQFWSDVLIHYPHLLHRLPRDSTVLHWGYDDRADYAGTARLVGTGLPTIVCPGTSGWKRIINALDLAERNISRFAEADVEHGACGLLNTDWGDHGHFNLLGCSWHGIALGACKGWNAGHVTGPIFDEAFARMFLGLDDATGVAHLRAASHVAGRCETWRLLYSPVRQVAGDPTIPLREEVSRLRQSARDMLAWCGRVSAIADQSPTIVGDVASNLAEYSVSCRFSELLADKIELIHAANDTTRLRRDRMAWAEKLMEAARPYAACWHARNKPCGLDDVLTALDGAGRDIRDGKALDSSEAP